MRVKVVRFLALVVLGAAVLQSWAGQPEAHVEKVVARVLANVAKMRAADPTVVPMAFWDFDGTIIKGDLGDGLVEDGKVAYRGLVDEIILAGLNPIYKGPEGVLQWRDDYQRLAKIGSWLSQGFDAQMFAGVSVAELDAFCVKTIEEGRYSDWYFASSMAIWKALAAAGVENYVVSASIEAMMRNAATTLDLPRDRIRATRVVQEGGRWTIKVVHPIPYGEGKVDAVQDIVRARPHGVAIAAFGNSYSTDAPFLRYVATQPSLPGGAKGTALMINGGKTVPGFSEHFICVEQHSVQGQ